MATESTRSHAEGTDGKPITRQPELTDDKDPDATPRTGLPRAPWGLWELPGSFGTTTLR